MMVFIDQKVSYGAMVPKAMLNGSLSYCPAPSLLFVGVSCEALTVCPTASCSFYSVS